MSYYTASENLLAFKKNRGSCKKSWSPHEDALLQDLVKIHGTSSWTKIAEGLSTRTGKQCRERYHNHLQPNIRKGDWTEDEDRIIVEMQLKLGNQWAKITKMLPGRTDNAVKNRWHAAMRSQGRPTYDSKSSYGRKGRSHPSVPRLAFDEAGLSARKKELSEEDIHNLFGSDSGRESLGSGSARTHGGSRRGTHHSRHDHSNSARTDSSRTDSSRSTDISARMPYTQLPQPQPQDDLLAASGELGDVTMTDENGQPYSAFSPRLTDFLCFPLSSSSTNTALLAGRTDNDDDTHASQNTPADLLAIGTSPREVAQWLSASPRGGASTDNFNCFGAQEYLSSPTKDMSKNDKRLGVASSSSCSSSSSSSSGSSSLFNKTSSSSGGDSSSSGKAGSFLPSVDLLSTSQMSNKQFIFGQDKEKERQSDVQLFSSLRGGTPATAVSSPADTDSESDQDENDNNTMNIEKQEETRKHTRSATARSKKNVHGVMNAMSNTGDLSTLSNTSTSTGSTDVDDDDDSTDFAFLAFDRIEISPRWQHDASPRAPEVKRQRSDSTPIHMRDAFFEHYEEQVTEDDARMNVTTDTNLSWKSLEMLSYSYADDDEMFL